MSEHAEIAWTETQYGIAIKGEVRPIAVGPAEAERYRAANVDIHARQRTVYRDRVTAWEPLDRPVEHVLMTEPHDGHGKDETCPGCPHNRPAPTTGREADDA